MKNVKDRLSELRKQISLLYRTSVPPLLVRYQNVTQDCLRIRDALERNWSELDKLNSIFQSVWQEQICRIHVEQDVFHSQVCLLVLGSGFPYLFAELLFGELFI